MTDGQKGIGCLAGRVTHVLVPNIRKLDLCDFEGGKHDMK